MPEHLGMSPEELGLTAVETKDVGESARVETIGDIDPATLTSEEFNQKAWLFHGSRNPNFQVSESYDYLNDFIDDATLGGGLYTTVDRDLAENYANTRPGGTMWSLMPFRANMLNLTSSGRMANLPFPRDLVAEWINFAQPKVVERVTNPTTSPEVQSRLIDVLTKMAELPSKDYVDLRQDILDTANAPMTVVDDIWKAFCRSKGFDGVIFVEGGDSDSTRRNDRTYVFYNSSKIGTFEDWQRRRVVSA